MLRGFRSLGLGTMLLSCAATLLGQTFGDSVIGLATVCKTVKFLKNRQGNIPTTQVTDSCADGCCATDQTGTTTATASANVGPLGNRVKVIANSTSAGPTGGPPASATVSGAWVDTVTFVPPISYSGDQAAFRLHDDYLVTVSGPVPVGNIAATVCYYIFSANVDDCTDYDGDVQNTKVTVDKGFVLTKNSSGQFMTQISVNGAVGTWVGDTLTGTALSQIDEPNNNTKSLSFTCPGAGWYYLLLSSPGELPTCNASKK